MGLFGWSKKQRNPQHEFWGVMVDAGDYFECRRSFVPKYGDIEICLAKSEVSSGHRQIDFFTQVENNYDKICSSVKPIIEEEVRNWKPQYTINEFRKEFTPCYITIPSGDTDMVDWEIAFDSSDDPNHTYSAKMRGLTAASIHIDG